MSEENADMETHPASVLVDPEMDPSNSSHSAALDTNRNTNIPKTAPPDISVTTSEDDKQPPNTHEHNADNSVTTYEADADNSSSNEVKVNARPKSEGHQLSSQVVTNSKNLQNFSVQTKTMSNVMANIGQVDTTAPFESVKVAVSKFGGIVDWKAHRVQTVERRKIIEQELERAQEEIPSYKKQLEVTDEAKREVLKELDSAKRFVEELKLNLERAQNEEQQVQQDLELAKLRVEEIQQGIADEASFAARAQLDVARARYTTALSELKFVKDELELLKRDYSLVLIDKDLSMKKAEEAVAWSKDIERSVEDLTIQLMTVKESLESAHAALSETEEHRIGAVMAKEQDMLNWKKELKNTEHELERVTRQISSSHDLKLKLQKASVLLQDLKDELVAYVESKLEKDEVANPDNTTRMNIVAAMSEAKKELEQVKLNLKKTNEEASILRMATTALLSELEREKEELAALHQREGMAGIAASALESELKRTESEISLLRVREKEEREKIVELPKKLQEAALEVEREKVVLEAAQEELRKVKEEAERVRAGAATVESRLRATRKEIEVARTSEKLAVAAISALVESESDGPAAAGGVTLTLEEYYELNKQAHDAEEHANAQVVASLLKIEAAKESELRSLRKLEEAEQERAEGQAALEMALENAEMAKEGKLLVEQELRKWRTEHEQRRKTGGGESGSPNNPSKMIFEEKLESKNSSGTPNLSALPVSSPKSYTSYMESPELRMAKKKKRSLFPKILMFLRIKKWHASSKLSS